MISEATYTILIVDDQVTNLEVLSDLLENQGFKVLSARNGETTLDIVQHIRPALILLDVVLPGIDGFAVCHQLKSNQQTQNIPIIFMTVLEKIEDKVRGFQLGAVDYITKPFQVEEVLARVTTQLHIQSLTRELQDTNEMLEQRVKERTAQLTQANNDLHAEIVERRLAEEALATERNLLRTVIDNLPDYIYAKDTEGRFILKNLADVRLIGATSPDEVIGRTDFDYYPSELANKYHRDDLAVVQSKQPLINREEPITAADGAEGWILTSKVPLLDSQGQVIGLVGIGRDVTERKQAEVDRQIHLQFMESMDKVNRIIQSTSNPEQMMNDVLDSMLSIFNCDRAWLVYPCDPQSPSLEVKVERFRPEYPGAFAMGIDIPMSPSNARNLEKLLDTPIPLSFGPGGDFSVPEDIARDFGVQSFISMAIYPKVGKPWQLGLHQCSYARTWTGEDKQLFQEIGRRLADGLTSLLAHQSLLEREQAYRTLVENIPVFVVRYNTDLQRIYVNPAWEKVSGIPSGSIVGISSTELPIELNAVNKGYLEKLHLALKTSEVQQHEFEWVNTYGETLFLDYIIVPEHDQNGEIVSLLCVGHDLTERKKAQTAMERYMQRLSILREIDHHILTARSTYIIADTVLQQLIQLIPCEFVSVVVYNDTITEERVFAWHHTSGVNISAETSQQVVPNDVLEKLKSGQTAITDNLEMQLGPKAHLADDLIGQGLCAAMACPLIVQDKLIGALALASSEIGFFSVEHQQIAEEISAQIAIAINQAKLYQQIEHHNIELEQRVRERTRQLESANRELEMFSYSVSHDLRAPLRAIQGFAEIIARRHRDDLNEEGQRYFGHIITAGKQMDQLITDLLDYARLGRQRLRLESLDLTTILDSVLSSLIPRIESTQAQIEVLDELPTILGDETLLKQIFTNLLENAFIYHRPDISPVIKISCQIEDDHATIQISDNGIGISSEFHEKIFNVFQRLHSSDQYPGTGIGLAIVRRSIELLSGSVWVESETGGSTFFIKLPQSKE